MFKGPIIKIEPKMGYYRIDGSGRDSYIYSNNGGFVKKFKIYNSDSSIRPPIVTKYDMSLHKPINRYRNKGGRDMYVLQSNSMELNRHDYNLTLPSIVRNEDIQLSPRKEKLKFLSIQEKKHYTHLHDVERRLLNRVFYGKETGVDERRLSPKVRFALKSNQLAKITPKYSQERCLTESNDSDITEHWSSLLKYSPRRK